MVEKLMCGNVWWHIDLRDTYNMRHVGMVDNMSASGLVTCEVPIPCWLITCQLERFTTCEVPIPCCLTTCRLEDWKPVKSPYLVSWQHVSLSNWWPEKSLYLNMSAWATGKLRVRVEVVLGLCINCFSEVEAEVFVNLGTNHLFEWRSRCFSALVSIAFDGFWSEGLGGSRPWYQLLLIEF